MKWSENKYACGRSGNEDFVFCCWIRAHYTLQLSQLLLLKGYFHIHSLILVLAHGIWFDQQGFGKQNTKFRNAGTLWITLSLVTANLVTTGNLKRVCRVGRYHASFCGRKVPSSLSKLWTLWATMPACQTGCTLWHNSDGTVTTVASHFMMNVKASP